MPFVKCLWITVKTSKAFTKNKYDCQTWSTKGIIDVKEQNGLQMKNFEAGITSWPLYTCVYSFLGYWYKYRNMATK